MPTKNAKGQARSKKKSKTPSEKSAPESAVNIYTVKLGVVGGEIGEALLIARGLLHIFPRLRINVFAIGSRPGTGIFDLKMNQAFNLVSLYYNAAARIAKLNGIVNKVSKNKGNLL